MLHKKPAFAIALKCCELWLGEYAENINGFDKEKLHAIITDICNFEQYNFMLT